MQSFHETVEVWLSGNSVAKCTHQRVSTQMGDCLLPGLLAH